MFNLEFPNDHSIFYYLLLVVLVIAFLQAFGIGLLFFFKRSGEFRSNAFFGLLLMAIALTLLHYIFIFTNIYANFPSLHYLPLYYTLAFPTFLFYHVKLALYPQYRMRWTDAKHFILPAGQFLFFVISFLLGRQFDENYGRQNNNPFYGAFEQFLYLVTFFAYLYFSHRYIKRKKGRIKHRGEAKQVWYATKLIQVLFILFSIHALFMVTDFIFYSLLNINLRANRPFAALGILSFTALLFCMGTYGFQVLLWGRKMFKRR